MAPYLPILAIWIIKISGSFAKWSFAFRRGYPQSLQFALNYNLLTICEAVIS